MREGKVVERPLQGCWLAAVGVRWWKCSPWLYGPEIGIMFHVSCIFFLKMQCTIKQAMGFQLHYLLMFLKKCDEQRQSSFFCSCGSVGAFSIVQQPRSSLLMASLSLFPLSGSLPPLSLYLFDQRPLHRILCGDPEASMLFWWPRQAIAGSLAMSPSLFLSFPILFVCHQCFNLKGRYRTVLVCRRNGSEHPELPGSGRFGERCCKVWIDYNKEIEYGQRSVEFWTSLSLGYAFLERVLFYNGQLYDGTFGFG